MQQPNNIQDGIQLKETALHEAAHFITFCLYFSSNEIYSHVKGLVLSIIPDEEGETLGHFRHRGLSALEREEIYLNKKHTLAGYAIEFILSEGEDSKDFLGEKLLAEGEWPGSDAYQVIDLVLIHSIDPETDIADLLLPIFEEVVIELKQHWYLVEKVAERLLKHNEVKGEQLENLTTEILNSLSNRAI